MQNEDVVPKEIYEFAYQKYEQHIVALRIPGRGGVELFDTVKLFAENRSTKEYERVKDQAADFAKQFVSQFNRDALPQQSLVEAASRALVKLQAYVGVCAGDKELTQAIIPMLTAALREYKNGGK